MQFRRITWPLIWPVTVLVFTIQLILQLKIFDQVYLFAANVRTDATMVMVQYIFKQAFQMNQGRSCGLGLAGPVRGDRRRFGAAISDASRARSDMSALAQAPSAPRRSPGAALRACAASTRSASLITLATFGARDLLGVPALLGDWSRRSSPSTRSCGPASTLAGAFHASRIIAHVLTQTKIGIWYLNSLITSAARDRHRRHHGRRRRLCDLAAQFPRPAGLLVDDPGELHGADPGADRHSFRR